MWHRTSAACVSRSSSTSPTGAESNRHSDIRARSAPSAETVLPPAAARARPRMGQCGHSSTTISQLMKRRKWTLARRSCLARVPACGNCCPLDSYALLINACHDRKGKVDSCIGVFRGDEVDFARKVRDFGQINCFTVTALTEKRIRVWSPDRRSDIAQH